MLETRTGQFNESKLIMTSLITTVNTPKVFGHLYVAIFSNGTVKAGRSASDPKGRVTTHANSGKAFDIHLDSAFYASIYTNDVSARERLMHQEIGLKARLTTGKEWFKFEDATTAANFASAYLCRVERMSFAERPSVETLLMQAKDREQRDQSLHGRLVGAIFSRPRLASNFLSPTSSEEEKKMELMLHEYSPSVAVSLARKIMDYEDLLAQVNDEFDSGLPLLVEAINQGWDEALSALADPNDFQDRCKAIDSMSFNSSLRILKAAANYPNFFYEAIGRKEVAA